MPFVILFLGSCDEVFEPWQENDRYHFSIYGMLDASVDTQWVRVMPVREDLLYEPSPIDAVVTLEHMESGETVVMNDSLISYPQGTYTWNFWTTMNLEPEQTYQLTVERSDGETSSAQVTLPRDFPTPEVRMGRGFNDPNVIYIDRSIERLVDVQTIFHGLDTSTGTVLVRGFPHLQDTVRSSSDFHTVYIDPREDRVYLVSFPPIIKQVVFVVNAGPDFHDFGSMDEKILTVPEGVSNIENGVGYLAGIVSKTVPYRNCFADDGFTYIPCPLVPDPW